MYVLLGTVVCYKYVLWILFDTVEYFESEIQWMVTCKHLLSIGLLIEVNHDSGKLYIAILFLLQRNILQCLSLNEEL